MYIIPTICNKTKAGGKSRAFKKKRFQFLPYVKAKVMANARCRLLKLCACYLSTKKRGKAAGQPQPFPVIDNA